MSSKKSVHSPRPTNPLPRIHLAFNDATVKTKHLVIYSTIFGTLLTMGFLQLFNTRSFALVSAVAVCVFAFYGLGLAVIQGLPVTPRFKLTTLDRYVLRKRKVKKCTGEGGGGVLIDGYA